MTQAPSIRGSETVREGIQLTRPDGQKIRLSLSFLTAVGDDGRTVIRDVAIGDAQVHAWEEHGVLPHNAIVELGEGAKGSEREPRAAYIEKQHGQQAAGWSLTAHSRASSADFGYAGFIPTPIASGNEAEDKAAVAVASAQAEAWRNQGRLLAPEQIVAPQ